MYPISFTNKLRSLNIRKSREDIAPNIAATGLDGEKVRNDLTSGIYPKKFIYSVNAPPFEGTIQRCLCLFLLHYLFLIYVF